MFNAFLLGTTGNTRWSQLQSRNIKVIFQMRKTFFFFFKLFSACIPKMISQIVFINLQQQGWQSGNIPFNGEKVICREIILNNK